MTFSRPNIPYENAALPNSARYQNLSAIGRPPTAEMFDSDVNYCVDGLNELRLEIQGVVAGNIPGSDQAENSNKVLITDGNSHLSWTLVDAQNINDNAIFERHIAEQQVTRSKIGLQSVGANQVQDRSIPFTKIVDQTQNGVCVTGNDQRLFMRTSEVAGLPLLNIGGNQPPNFAQLPENSYGNGSVSTRAIADQGVTTQKLADQGVTTQKLAQEVIDLLMPTGVSLPFTGVNLPSNKWYWCDGSAKSRVDDAALFAVIGTRFGAGDGATTFNLPDIRGRFVAGIGNDNNTGGRITNASVNPVQIGGVGGEERHTLTVDEIPAHTHNVAGVPYFDQNHRISGGYDIVATYNTMTLTSSSVGGGQNHNNMSPFVLMPYIIKR